MGRRRSYAAGAAVQLLLLALLLSACAGPAQGEGSPQPALPATTSPAGAVPSTGGETATPAAQAPAETPPPGEDTFQNPVFRHNFPDPFVLQVGNRFYAYATNGAGRNVQAAVSDDLLNWTLLPDAMPALAAWVRLSNPDVWAPEVIEIDGRFFLYYTARERESRRQCIGVAVADQPQGRFVDSHDRPLVCQVEQGGSIDAHPFRDGEDLYLLWKNDGNCCGLATYIYAQKMSPDGLSLSGEPAILARNDRPWEGGIVEAPFMVEYENLYYLFYAGNSYAGFEYATGYAVCEAVTGPCEEAPKTPSWRAAASSRWWLAQGTHRSWNWKMNGGSFTTPGRSVPPGCAPNAASYGWIAWSGKMAARWWMARARSPSLSLRSNRNIEQTQ